MKLAQWSLTARMSLMFMLAVVLVLTIAGLCFSLFSQYHFRLLDQQILTDKLDSSQRLLQQVKTREDLQRISPQLQLLLGARPDLSALLVSAQGQVLFATERHPELPPALDLAAPHSMQSWQTGGQLYQGLSAHLSLPAWQEPVRLLLSLDVTTHAHFFETLQRWFWLGLLLSAVASAALGWVAVYNGLKPLRQVTALATSVSARSLKERIPLEPVPRELQQLMSAFNAMMARLDESFQRLSNFSADIAHELRTPVSNLLTQTEVTLSRPRDLSSYQDNLYSHLEELQRMSQMIDDMLFLAKADNGLIIPARTPIELRDEVQQLFDYYAALAEERGVELQLSGQGQTHGDRLMLRRALSNLISNALRYTASGQDIQVLISQTPEHVQLLISNPSAPIAAQHLSRLFDRFYRLDPARREGSTHNVGLGLAITHSIIKAHGGQLHCYFEQGRICFHIRLAHANTSPTQQSSA